MKNNLPIFSLLIAYAGAAANFMTEAKSVFGASAALASFIASLYAIAVARQRLKNAQRNPFSASAVKRLRSSRRPLRSSRSSRLKTSRLGFLRFLLLIPFVVAFSACSTRGPARARADRALTQSNEHLAEESRALTTPRRFVKRRSAESTHQSRAPLRHRRSGNRRPADQTHSRDGRARRRRQCGRRYRSAPQRHHVIARA